MTVNARTPSKTYIAAAAATVFPYDFRIFVTSDLYVTVDGVPKTLGTDYTVSGADNPNGGNVTFLSPMTGGETVVLAGNISAERDTDYQEGGDLLGKTHNNDHDYPVMLIKQVISRAMMVPAGDAAAGLMAIPSVATRKNMLAGYGADGTPAVYNQGSGGVTGAANVNFLQAGTGAISRTVQNRLRDTVSVKDFGAVGDGTTNDTAALQAAIDSLGTAGGTIMLPPGNYKVTAPLTPPAGINFAVPVRLIGAGKGVTKITSTHDGIMFDCRTSGYAALMLETMSLLGPGKTFTSSIGVDCQFAYGYMDRCQVTDFKIGIKAKDGNFTRVRQLDITGCGSGIAIQNTVLAASILAMQSCWVSFCDNGIKIENAGTILIEGSTYFEQNTTSIDIRTTSFVKLVGVYTEGETDYGFYGMDVFPTFDNCRFVTHEPHLEFSAPPALYGQVKTDGLRMGTAVDQKFNYNTGTKVYDVAFTDFVASGARYRCLGDTTSTTNAFEKVTAAGEITNPKQPTVNAYIAADTSNDKTGDGTIYKILFDTESVDQNADFASNTFTAPVAGNYLIAADINLANLGAGHTTGELLIYVNGTPFRKTELNPGAARTAANRCSMKICDVVPLAAADALDIRVTVSGSTKTVGFTGGALFTRMSAVLVS